MIVRVPSRDLLDGNDDLKPEFCKYNSGSSRCPYGAAFALNNRST